MAELIHAGAPLNILYEQFSALGEKWRCRRPRRSLRPIPSLFLGPFNSLSLYFPHTCMWNRFLSILWLYILLSVCPRAHHWYRCLWWQQDILSFLQEGEAAVDWVGGQFQGLWVGHRKWDKMLLRYFIFESSGLSRFTCLAFSKSVGTGIPLCSRFVFARNLNQILKIHWSFCKNFEF